MFKLLYETQAAHRRLFGAEWCGPDVFEHGVEYVVARMPRHDPQAPDVLVCEERYPASFVTVRTSQMEIAFGSGCLADAARVARLLACGMMEIRYAPVGAAKDKGEA